MPILNNIDPIQLHQFTGTVTYYKNIGTRKGIPGSYGGVHTDGCQFLCENGMAWFIEHVSIYHHALNQPFQVWKIIPDTFGIGATIKVEDGNNNELKQFVLDYADICCLNAERRFEVWCVDGVIMLPSEY